MAEFMNVLIVIECFGGVKDGNPDVVDLAIELNKRGHNVVVLTASYGNERGYEEKHGVLVFRIRPLYYFSRIDYSVSFPALKLHRLMREFDIEIVHGINEFGTQTLSAMMVSSIAKKPFILTLQGAARTFGASYVDAIASIYGHSFNKIISMLVEKVIILSENLSERARKIGVPPERIQAIPSGIHYRKEFNPYFFNSEQVRNEFGLKNKIVVGFSGRLVRLKGLFFLLHAIKFLQKDVHNCHLLIIGDGPERLFVESFSKKFNLDTTITGWVKRNQVPIFLSAVDIFVNPSLTEGLPIAVMEAMAMQKAVVATDVGGTCDLVKNGINGFLVPPGDVKSLVQAIKAVALDAGLRSNMGRAGRDIIRKNFSWETIVPKIEKVYKEAL